MKELNGGGYIMHDDTTTALYNRKGDRIQRVPVATLERFATMNQYRKFTRRREWGDTVYIGREGCSGWFNDLLNTEHCKNIADDLDDYAGGRVVKCPECGQLHTIDDDRPAHRCGACGYSGDVDDYDTMSIYDYFEDCLDIEYRCDTHREYRSVQIMVTCGGPNIYIDTASRRVELYWWGDSANYPLDSDTVAAVDEWAEELWGCM
jgi:hypothetical protein